MIKEFIDSVLIIDDKEKEVKDLKKILEDKDIWVTYFNPPKEKQEIEKISKPFRNRKLIFLDLIIDENKKIIENISVIIRPLFKKIISKKFGSYGIVMWTKHETHVSEFKQKIQNDANYYQLPLFIIGLDKSKYLGEDLFDNILNDLEEELKKSTAANFFINWSNLIRKGKDKAITSIFELIPDYQKQDKNLEFILFKMAQNYTGIPFDQIDDNYPLGVDAVKAFNDLLISEINFMSELDDLKFTKEENIFILSSENTGWFVKNTLKGSKKDLILKKITKNVSDDGKIKWTIGNNFTTTEKTEEIVQSCKDEILNLFSYLNSKLLIDEVNIKQDKIIPGNVYVIKDSSSHLRDPGIPTDATPVIIELTPPCDFSNNKTNYPRVLSGYIQDLDISNIPKKEKYYRELWPVKLKEREKPQIIVFDFSMLGFVEKKDLEDKNKYELLFRVRDKLFADILQKMSSYSARLGLSIIR